MQPEREGAITGLASNIAEAYHQTLPIRLSLEEFADIFHRALSQIKAAGIQYLGEGWFSFTTAPVGVPVSWNLFKEYDKRKFSTPQVCFESLVENLEMSQQGLRAAAQKQPLPNLYVTVKNHDTILSRNSWARLSASGMDSPQRIVYRPISANSGELYKALVIGVQKGRLWSDLWISAEDLDHWSISEDQAFGLGVQNMDRVTPETLTFRQVTSIEELQRGLLEVSSDQLALCLHLRIRKSRGVLHLFFYDGRALPRLLLPRFMEGLAAELQCDPQSLVVVPFADNTIYAASAEDKRGMMMLGKIQIFPCCQEDGVTKVRNKENLVELELYLLNGGRVAVKLWDQDKQKTFYPMPRTKEDVVALEKMIQKGTKFTFLTESAFLEGLCWQCRKPFEKLLMCASCKRARYCSRGCQKAAWKDGHNVNCEERRRFWEQAKMMRQPSKDTKSK